MGANPPIRLSASPARCNTVPRGKDVYPYLNIHRCLQLPVVDAAASILQATIADKFGGPGVLVTPLPSPISLSKFLVFSLLPISSFYFIFYLFFLQCRSIYLFVLFFSICFRYPEGPLPGQFHRSPELRVSICTCIDIYIYIYNHTHMHACMHTCIHTSSSSPNFFSLYSSSFPLHSSFFFRLH